MPMTVSPDDDRLAFRGIVSLRREADWVQPYRLPWAERALFNPELMARAGMPAGVRIAFTSDTTRVGGRVGPTPEMTPLDLVADGELVGTAEMDGAAGFAFEGLAAGEKRLELWLPAFGEFRLRGLELADGATLRAPADDEGPRWLTYGSSITQCRQAARPTETWPTIVARTHGLDLTCLGFGGQCHLDPMVALAMRDLPADLVSMCLGINIYGAASLSPRSFRPAIVGAVRIVRETHPDAPVVLVSPIYGVERERTKNPVGFTLPAMRAEVKAAAEDLRTAGDPNVHYVDGLEVLGPADADRLPDDLHPDAEGYRLMGRRFAERLAELVDLESLGAGAASRT